MLEATEGHWEQICLLTRSRRSRMQNLNLDVNFALLVLIMLKSRRIDWHSQKWRKLCFSINRRPHGGRGGRHMGNTTFDLEGTVTQLRQAWAMHLVIKFVDGFCIWFVEMLCYCDTSWHTMSQYSTIRRRQLDTVQCFAVSLAPPHSHHLCSSSSVSVELWGVLTTQHSTLLNWQLRISKEHPCGRSFTKIANIQQRVRHLTAWLSFGRIQQTLTKCLQAHQLRGHQLPQHLLTLFHGKATLLGPNVQKGKRGRRLRFSCSF